MQELWPTDLSLSAFWGARSPSLGNHWALSSWKEQMLGREGAELEYGGGGGGGRWILAGVAYAGWLHAGIHQSEGLSKTVPPLKISTGCL